MSIDMNQESLATVIRQSSGDSWFAECTYFDSRFARLLDPLELFPLMDCTSSNLTNKDVWLALHSGGAFLDTSDGNALRSVSTGQRFVPSESLFSKGPVGAFNDSMRIKTMVVSYSPQEDKFTTGLTPMSWNARPSFKRAALSAGFTEEDFKQWYLTTLVKWYPNFVGGKPKIPAPIKKIGFNYLLAEIALLKPEFIIAVGSDVIKAIFGQKATASVYMGLLADYTFKFPFKFEYKDGSFTPDEHEVKVVTIPATYYMDSAYEKAAADQLSLLHNSYFTKSVPIDNGMALVYTVEGSKAAVDDLMQSDGMIALDMEWSGTKPKKENSYLLTLQLCSREDRVYVFVLDPRYSNLASENKTGLVEQLNRLFTPTETWTPRLGGHFLRADLPWILDLGVDADKVKKAYAPSDSLEDCSTKGGWDTSLMLHAVQESRVTGFGLKSVCTELLGIPRWDLDLNLYSNEYSKNNKIPKKDLRLLGYSYIPPDILWPYAAMDAKATLALARTLSSESKVPSLYNDGYGNNVWKPYWIAHRSSLGFLEMEMTGLELDIERLTNLSVRFSEAYSILLNKLREDIRWPSFNPGSVIHKQSLLFSREYSKTASGYSMPEDALCLGLTPIRSTSKVEWDDIDDEDKDDSSPASDALSMNILKVQNPDNKVLQLLLDTIKLGQTLKGNLRPPVITTNEDGSETVTLDSGIITFEVDGRVGTHFRNTLATGRASSSDPAMQNIGKSAEDSLLNILGFVYPDGFEVGHYPEVFPGGAYLYPIRTIFTASLGHILLEADFKGAELAAMAYISQDEHMLEHVRRNALPENDPDFYDIHSNIAVKAFKLDCAPTKKAMKAIHKAHLRVAAKAVAFGVPYGRGAKSIALQVLSQGVFITVEQAQELMDAYLGTYPRVKVFLEECKRNVARDFYLKSPYDRIRHWPITDDARKIAKYGREASNFPIQSCIADSVNVAICNLLDYRGKHSELKYKLCMQIHDALLLECPEEQLEQTKEALQVCMVDNNPLVLDGIQRRFSIDIDVYRHWGEPI